MVLSPIGLLSTITSNFAVPACEESDSTISTVTLLLPATQAICSVTWNVTVEPLTVPVAVHPWLSGFLQRIVALYPLGIVYSCPSFVICTSISGSDLSYCMRWIGFDSVRKSPMSTVVVCLIDMLSPFCKIKE